MILIKHGINVINYNFYLMRANTTRNTQINYSAYQQEGLNVVANMLYLASGWNRNPIPADLLSDISQRCNGILASCPSELGL